MTRNYLVIAASIATVFLIGTLLYKGPFPQGVSDPTALTGSTASTVSALTLSVSAELTTAPAGGLKIRWVLNKIATCALTGDDHFSAPPSMLGSVVLNNVTGPKTFIVTCTAQGETVTRSVSLDVNGAISITTSGIMTVSPTPTPTSASTPPPTTPVSPTPTPTSSLTPAPILTSTPPPTASPSSVPTLSLNASSDSISAGKSVKLTWSSGNATSCRGFGSWSGSMLTEGSRSVFEPGIYGLTCSGLGGAIGKVVTVTETQTRTLPVLALPNLTSAPTTPVLPSVIPSPTPPTVPSDAYVISSTLKGGPDLVAEFPVDEGLKSAWSIGAIPGLYGGQEGAFRFTCGGEGPLRYDDPLVYPGQPGKSHLHLFWGPMDIDAHTTVDSLAASQGNSNCNYGSKTLNRSAYWSPALLDDADYVHRPDWIAVYYKQPKASSSRCTPGSANFQGTCVGIPNKIQMIFGWDPTKPDAPVQGASWYCSGGDGKHYRNLDDVFNSGCRVGDTLVADMAAPNCWDGKNLDTPNHRAHTAYASYGSQGYLKCPASHPYVIPQNESKLAWTVTIEMYKTISDGTKRSRLRLSSDHMKPGAKPGETLHSDYMEAWVGKAKEMWQDNCINKGLSCSGGDLGNGLQLIGASQPSYGFTNPNPKSSMPMSDMKMQ